MGVASAEGSRLDDPARIAALGRTGLLDSPPDDGFDRLTALAARLLGVPAALITLVDDRRQFFKSGHGLPPALDAARGSPLEYSVCRHVVSTGRPLIVEDSGADPQLKDNPAVGVLGIGAYLGVPLALDGHVIGSFCAIDRRPRHWCGADIALMADLARSVVAEIRCRAAEVALAAERAAADDMRIKLSAALDAAHISTWRFDPATDEVVPDINLARLFGVAVRPGENGPLEAFIRAIHPEDRERVVTRLREAIATSGSYAKEFRIIADDGSTRFVESRGGPVFDAAGRLAALAGVVVDNTERMLLEQARGESEARYRRLFEAIDEGFCVIEVLFDEAGRPRDWLFIETNPGFEKQTGLLGTAGRRMYEMIPEHEPSWLEHYGRVARSGEPLRFEHEAKALGRWFDLYAFPAGPPGSGRVAVLFTDITGRKREQAERETLVTRLREDDAAKNRFLAMLAHELRNPLAALRSGMNLTDRLREPMRLGEVRGLMRHQLEHLTRLVDDLLDTARVTQGKVELRRERVPVCDLAARAVALARPLIEERGHRLTLDLPGPPVTMFADPVRVEQMLSNLLTNAAKYSDPARGIAFSAASEDGWIVFRIRDEGFGIEPEMLTGIFGLFTQLDTAASHARGGLGLGLALVRSLAELHGGTIEARSEGRGTGAEFVLRLPAGGDEEPAAAVGSVLWGHSPSS